MIGDCEATISPSATKGPAEPGPLGVSDQEPTSKQSKVEKANAMSIHEEWLLHIHHQGERGEE